MVWNQMKNVANDAVNLLTSMVSPLKRARATDDGDGDDGSTRHQAPMHTEAFFEQGPKRLRSGGYHRKFVNGTVNTSCDDTAGGMSVEPVSEYSSGVDVNVRCAGTGEVFAAAQEASVSNGSSAGSGGHDAMEATTTVNGASVTNNDDLYPGSWRRAANGARRW